MDDKQKQKKTFSTFLMVRMLIAFEAFNWYLFS